MNRNLSLFALAWLSIALAGCHAHKEMQYTPAQYAKLRGIELITTPPTRAYELVVTVEGFGGRFTAKETMINGFTNLLRMVLGGFCSRHTKKGDL